MQVTSTSFGAYFRLCLFFPKAERQTKRILNILPPLSLSLSFSLSLSLSLSLSICHPISFFLSLSLCHSLSFCHYFLVSLSPSLSLSPSRKNPGRIHQYFTTL